MVWSHLAVPSNMSDNASADGGVSDLKPIANDACARENFRAERKHVKVCSVDRFRVNSMMPFAYAPGWDASDFFSIKARSKDWRSDDAPAASYSSNLGILSRVSSGDLLLQDCVDSAD